MTHYLDIVLKLRESDAAAGYINSSEIKNYPNIPELSSKWQDVCIKIANKMKDYMRKKHEGKTSDPGKMAIDFFYTTYAWCAYAGIGAVYHWNINWEALNKAGIFETLTAPRGLFAMDEYVMDSVGLPYDSEEENVFRTHLKKQLDILMAITFNKTEDDMKQAFGCIITKQAFECMRAMYEHGIQIEMYRLGMK